MTIAPGLPRPVPARSPVHNLSSLLAELVNGTSGPTVDVREMLNAIGRRSYGPILLLLGFLSLSPLTIIPGATWLVALITLMMAAQIVIGRRKPWLPSSVLKVEFPREALVKGVDLAQPFVSGIDGIVKPRLAFLTESPFVQLVALVCIAAALITFPLGLVPLGPLLPGLTIFLFGLALTARDGVVLLISGVMLVAGFWLLIRLGDKVTAGLAHVFEAATRMFGG